MKRVICRSGKLGVEDVPDPFAARGLPPWRVWSRVLPGAPRRHVCGARRADLHCADRAAMAVGA